MGLQNMEEKSASAAEGFTTTDHEDMRVMTKSLKRRAATMTSAAPATYQVNNDLAKKLINQDKFTREDGQRIMVQVPGEAPVTDMMMPAPTEPSQGYAPSAVEGGEFPPMIVLLCEQDEDVGPHELQAKLAELFKVDPSRFAITVADG
jgi:hypothetical protein